MNKSKLLHDGFVLLYSTAIANRIGRNEAIALQQIHYWLGVAGGKVVDGTKWFWKTYQQWSQELLLSVSTVRRVINKLHRLGLIKISRLAAKTYYQANWYTLNQEAVFALIQNEQMDVTNLNTSMCSRRTDDIIEFSSADFSSKKQAAEKEKCLEPDWDKVEQQVNQWELEQLTGEPTSSEQPKITRSVDDNSQDLPTNELSYREDASPPSDGDELSFPNSDRNCENEDFSSNSFDSQEASPPVESDRVHVVSPKGKALLQAERPLELCPSVNTTSPPSNEREEENIKLCEVRSTVGKLTPRLKKLIAENTLGDLRKALELYRDRCSKQQIRDAEGWLKKCLQQRWWQDKESNRTTDSRDIPIPKRATEKLTQEQKVWYENAIALGICLPAAIEELPIRMGLVCARVVIPNRRPFDPPFEVLPIEKLMVQYPINAAAEVES